jgi:hypothetical protein
MVLLLQRSRCKVARACWSASVTVESCVAGFNRRRVWWNEGMVHQEPPDQTRAWCWRVRWLANKVGEGEHRVDFVTA